MTYWNETSDLHLQFGPTSKYQEFPAINQHINSEGYVGDLLAPSEVVFLGTCDIMSIADKPELHWARQLHKQLHLDLNKIHLLVINFHMFLKPLVAQHLKLLFFLKLQRNQPNCLG